MLLRNGFILGCDNQYFYEGRYVLDDGGFRALVKVSHYAGDRAVSIFGEFGPFANLESFQAELRGDQDSNGTLQLSGGVTGDPDKRLAVALTRLVPNPAPPRLLEVFGRDDVLAGVREAIARGVISFGAVKHLVLCGNERRPPRLDLKIYPYCCRPR